MLDYYLDELRAFAHAAAGSKVQLWRTVEGVPVAPLFAEAAMATLPSAIDATLLMHEVTSFSGILETSIRRALTLFPSVPVVVMMNKVWKVCAVLIAARTRAHSPRAPPQPPLVNSD